MSQSDLLHHYNLSRCFVEAKFELVDENLSAKQIFAPCSDGIIGRSRGRERKTKKLYCLLVEQAIGRTVWSHRGNLVVEVVGEVYCILTALYQHHALLQHEVEEITHRTERTAQRCARNSP